MVSFFSYKDLTIHTLVLKQEQLYTIVYSPYSVSFKGKEDPYFLLELFFFEVFFRPEFLLNLYWSKHMFGNIASEAHSLMKMGSYLSPSLFCLTLQLSSRKSNQTSKYWSWVKGKLFILLQKNRAMNVKRHKARWMYKAFFASFS